MTNDKQERYYATVSQLPWHDGDGYSYGGDVILTIGERSINLGAFDNGKTLKFAHTIADALNARDNNKRDGEM